MAAPHLRVELIIAMPVDAIGVRSGEVTPAISAHDASVFSDELVMLLGRLVAQ